MTRTRRNRRLCAGFTLVEALATLLLLAIVLPVAMRGVSLATRAASQTLKTRELSALARDRLNEAIVQKEWNDGDTKGDFTEDEIEGFQWSLTVTTWNGDDTLKALALKVWRSDDASQTVTLHTVVYDASAASNE